MAHVDIDFAQDTISQDTIARPNRARFRPTPGVGPVPAAILGALAMVVAARFAGFGSSLAVLAVVLVLSGLLVGGFASLRMSHSDGRRSTAWDLAGGLTLVGCASAMLTD